MRRGDDGRDGRGAGAATVTLPARPEPIRVSVEETAVVVIDMQNAYASQGGYVDLAGFDIAGAAGTIGQIAKVLETARAAGRARSSISRTAGTRIMSRRAGRARPTGTSPTRSRPCARGPSCRASCSPAAAGIMSWSMRWSRSPATSSSHKTRYSRLLQFAARQHAARARHPQHRLRRHRHQCLRRDHAARRLPPRIFRGDAGGCDPSSRPRFHAGGDASTMSRNSSAGCRTVADFCGSCVRASIAPKDVRGG